MRLVSRLFVLFLLITILAFTSLVSQSIKADDGGTCQNECDRKYILCYQGCGDTNSAAGSACSANCSQKSAECYGKCGNAVIAPVEGPVN